MRASVQRRITEDNALFGLVLSAITLIAAGLRFYRLGINPECFHHDEMMLAYDSWSLWKTGADQHGAFLPTHFRAFNEYLPGLAQYITAPFVGLLGLNETAARLPFAGMGTAAVLGTGLLGRLWFGRVAGLLAALFLAIDPWAVAFSRLALVNSCVPIFTVLALLTFTKTVAALQGGPTGGGSAMGGRLGDHAARRPLGWLVLCALCFALLMRTYQPMKLEAPLLFGICLAASFRTLVQKRRAVLFLWVGLFLLFASPQIVDQLLHWNLYQLQFRHNSAFATNHWPLLVARHYAEFFDPSRLLFRGLSGMIEHGNGIGNVFWLEGPLWIVAGWGLARGRALRGVGFSLAALLSLWCLAYPVAASLTDSSASENRTVGVLPLPELLAGYGFAVLVQSLWRLRPARPWLAPVLSFALTLGLLTVVVQYEARFVRHYFRKPYRYSRVDPADLPLNVGLREALEETVRRSTSCDLIYLDALWIFYLFEMRVPPSTFQNQPKIEENVPPDDFLQVAAFGNVRFSRPSEWSFKAKEPAPPCHGPYRRRFVTRETSFDASGPVWHTVHTVNNMAGEPIWRVLEADGS